MLCLQAGDSSARPGKLTERLGSAGTARGTAAHCIGKRDPNSGRGLLAVAQLDESYFWRAVIANGKRRTTRTRTGVRLHRPVLPGAVGVFSRALGVVAERPKNWQADLPGMSMA